MAQVIYPSRSVMSHGLQTYFDALAQPMLLVDSEGRIALANRSSRELAKRLFDDAKGGVGHSYKATYLAEAQMDAAGKDDLARRLNAVLSGDATQLSADLGFDLHGQRHWYMMHAEALPDGGAVVSHFDVTEIRTLDEARTRFAFLANDSNEYVLLIDDAGGVFYANPAARGLTQGIEGSGSGSPSDSLLTHWSEVLARNGTLRLAQRTGVWRGEIALPLANDDEVWFSAVVYAQPKENAEQVYYSVLLHDISEDKRREEQLHNRHIELEIAYAQLKDAQDKLLQSEKMASIGLLAAGVAHEINNPIGYVHSNLGTLQEYISGLFRLIDGYEQLVRKSERVDADALRRVEQLRTQIDIGFISGDLPSLLAESREGIERVKKIVQDLKDFSHTSHGEEWSLADLHAGLDSTLNIVANELKYKADVVKHYGDLPLVECLPSQLVQVFMNLLINAAHAIERHGQITVATGTLDDHVWITIADTGVGMTDDVLQRIFDPFFTTKPVGQGTGLGLSLSYGIIKKHNGRIEVSSEPGVGTEFRIVLPTTQNRDTQHAPATGPT